MFFVLSLFFYYVFFFFASFSKGDDFGFTIGFCMKRASTWFGLNSTYNGIYLKINHIHNTNSNDTELDG